MDFVAIDFETANNNRGSACSIGIVTVESGVIVNKEHYYIKPFPFYFEARQQNIHKITEDLVLDKPLFSEHWNNLKLKFENKLIVAHNAAFDLSVLRYALKESELPFPDLEYICTWRLSEILLPNLSNYKLSEISRLYNISLNHHNALSDAEACANIALNLLKENNSNCLKKLSLKNKFKIGQIISPNSYEPFSSKATEKNNFKSNEHRLKGDLLKPDFENSDENSPFYRMKVVFTGVLSEISRKEAAVKVKELGADIDLNITKRTNFIIVGENPGPVKMKKIKKFKEDGSNIEILYENEFIEMINY
jgi:DNA polymerase-3 subunit epsilon